MSQYVSSLNPNTGMYPLGQLSKRYSFLPQLHAIGELQLIHLPITAIFCSRKCPGGAILKAYDLARDLREQEAPVIGGFHTPVEKDMLDILLKGKGPIVICPARGLDGMRIESRFRSRLRAGTLLFCSVAPAQARRVTSELAEERNYLVAALASDWKFIHVEPGGRLEAMKKKLDALREPQSMEG
jgi:predicted Rossmann fold nucleotide-binding protein DprA/Smf involved in DNA uptake